jgi:hypothetical protein
MNYLVIYPGRFHIFHLGHKAVYDYLVKEWEPKGGSVYIATSDVQAPVTSPFDYSDKVAMLTKMGVPASHIIKVKNPYSIDEYATNLPDASNTVLIFAIGAKDQKLVKDANGKVIQRPRFNFNPTREGKPSQIQPLPENLNKCQPIADKVAYVEVVDTQEFKVRGKTITSASEIRKDYIEGNDADRDQIIMDLYGSPDSNLRNIFDKKLGVTDHVVKMMQECRRIGTARSMALMERIISAEREVLREFAFDDVDDQDEDPDYIDEKWSKKYKRSINCANPRGFSQRAHCAGRKK